MECNVLGCTRDAKVTLAFADPKETREYCMICAVYKFKNDERAKAIKKGIDD